ncbi:MAG: serine protease [Nitrospira sp.]
MIRQWFRFQVFVVTLLIVSTSALAAPVSPEVKSVVAYVLIEQEGKLVPNGTGFFVGVKDPSRPEVYSVYLVTARHVLFKPKTKDFLSKVFLRINRKDGGSDVGAVLLVPSGKNQNVFVHPDTSVDLAAVPMLPNQSKYDFKFLPDEFLTSKNDFDALHIREGSDVFFTGLFTQYPGAQRNHPIVRFGRVALVTDEKIAWDGQDMDLYLIEAASYGGNSGSPVFFYLGSDREPGALVVGPPIIKLAGIMQGTFMDAQEIRAIDTAKIPISVASMGIAAIVPAYKLRELLEAEAAKKARGF